MNRRAFFGRFAALGAAVGLVRLPPVTQIDKWMAPGADELTRILKATYFPVVMKYYDEPSPMFEAAQRLLDGPLRREAEQAAWRAWDEEI